ncbi:MAG: YceI family protein [Acidimicrobiales bacterium]
MTDTTQSAVTRTVDGREAPAPGTYVLDDVHTHVGFVVRHLMIAKVKGRFTSFRGTLTVADEPSDSRIDVTIDSASVDTRDEGRDAHLRSADFFEAERFPTITYQSTKVTRAGGDRWVVDGDLTIHGVTKPVRLDVTFEGGVSPDPFGNARTGFSATGQLNREDFGLTWNAALESGGVLVGKDVKIDIEAELIRQQ